MKNLLTIICIFFAAIKINAQNIDSDNIGSKSEGMERGENDIYYFVQKKAEPKLGMEKFYLDFKERFFIEDNSVLENEIDVRFKFIVEKDGSFTNIQILGDKLNFGDKVINIFKKNARMESCCS